MQPLLIIDRFEKMADRGSRLRHRLVFTQVDFFVLERFHKALRLRVVISIAAPRHADADVMLFEQVRVV